VLLVQELFRAKALVVVVVVAILPYLLEHLLEMQMVVLMV
jgi:hypothetical protein